MPRESPCPEEEDLASIPGSVESLEMERTRKTAPKEAVGRRIDAGQDAKTEMLVYHLVGVTEQIHSH